MQQKRMWMRYLPIGISIFLFLCISCKKTDYQVKSKWIYINETSHNITYSPDYWSKFNVNPHDTIIYFEEGDGSKEITENSFVSPLRPEIIIYDGIKCDSLKVGDKPYLGDGPLGMSNYANKKLGERYYEFTYRFTEEMFNNAKNCH